MVTTKLNYASVLKALDGQALEVGAVESPCGLALVPQFSTEMRVGEVYCDGVRHYTADEAGTSWARERCPELRRREIQTTVATEERRLAGELAEASQFGPLGFDAFDRSWSPKAAEAWAAMRAFADGRPPRRGVFMSGSTGLGKTRLLLESHFGLLRAGVASLYLRSRELRRLFQQAQSFDEDIAHEARLALDLIVRAEAVHLDELGDVQDDERKRGPFQEGLKDLLDRRRNAWAVATNLSYEAAEKHPDVGQKIISRLIAGATVVRCSGKDFRIAKRSR